MLLLGVSLLVPFPLSNVPISLAIVLLAFAHLEEDGILLACALVIALGLFAVGTVALWSAFVAAVWVAW